MSRPAAGHLSLAAFSQCQILVWPGFNLTLVWNGGMSFGLFRGGADFSRWALTIFAVVVAGRFGLVGAQYGQAAFLPQLPAV